MASKFGGKYLFGGGILGTAVLSIITPPVAQLSVYALVALRVVEGLFEVRQSVLVTIIIENNIPENTCFVHTYTHTHTHIHTYIPIYRKTDSNYEISIISTAHVQYCLGQCVISLVFVATYNSFLLC